MKSPIAIIAALAAIPIATSSVRGVDYIINQKTDFPIRDIEDVSLYAATIRYSLEHPVKAESLALSARQYVENEHTQATFELAVVNSKGYFNNSSLPSSAGGFPCAV